MFIYYVYAYLRSDGTPYYIGKGKGNRAFVKHKGHVPTDKTRIVFLEQNLSDIGALSLERFYIRWYGRKDKGTGILRNLTDGGDGAAGVMRTDAQKQNISTIHKGKVVSRESVERGAAKRRGKIRSEEHKRKISEANKGRRPSEYQLQRSREVHTGKKHTAETIAKRVVKTCKPCTDGQTTYHSLTEMCRVTGLSQRGAINRIASTRFPNFSYL